MATERQSEVERTEQLLQNLTESILATLRDLVEENAQLRTENVDLRRRLVAYEPPGSS